MVERGAQVLWGTGAESGTAHPYGPWVELLGRRLDGLDAEGLRDLLGADAAVLADLVPAVRDALSDLPAPAPLAADEARLRLYEAVVRLLDGLDGTTLIVLDDLHLADAAALDLFVHVARFAQRPRLLATYRGEALDLAHPLAQSLGEVQRHRPCEYVLLARLGPGEAATLLERVAGRPVEAELGAAIYAESAGNPFFIAELGRHLHRHWSLVSGDVDTWSVPQTVLGAIGLRLAPLSAEARHVLDLAAVFRGSFGFAELQAVTELDEDTLLSCVEEALGADLIRPVGPERYGFAHDLVRHALYGRFSPSRRSRLHRRVADALEAVHAEDTAPVAAELARHYHASRTLPGAERGVEHALTAAARARAALASADAIPLLEQALDLVGDGDTATRARVLGELALGQAEAVRLDDALATLDAALTLMERDGADPARVADLLYEVGSALATMLALPLQPLVARGLAVLGPRHDLPWARLKLLERASDPDVRPLRWLNLDPEAVRILREHGTEKDYARTIDPTAPLPAAELLARVETWHDAEARLRGLEMLSWHLTLYAPEASPLAERVCAELEQLADAAASPMGRVVAALSRGALLGARGELDAAVERLERARLLTGGWPSSSWIPRHVVLVLALTREHVAPDWAGAAESLLEATDRSDQTVWDALIYTAYASYAFARGGLRERAEQLLADVVVHVRAHRPFHGYMHMLVNFAGATAWELRSADAAAPLLAWLASLSEEPDHYMTSTPLTIARMLTVLDRFEEAAPSFERARAATERSGQRPLRAIVDHDEAVARSWRGQPGAAALMAQATQQFAALGMTEWSRRVALREPAEPELPDGLTPREAEILRLLAAGGTNRQIASELVLSVHTVERHVQNAYRKIDAHNRADATAYALRALL